MFIVVTMTKDITRNKFDKPLTDSSPEPEEHPYGPLDPQALPH